MGPTPTPPVEEPPAQALDPARRRLLRLLTDLPAAASAATVAELAARVGGHPNTTRHHLRALAAAGLVQERVLPAGGRGRPATLYSVTPSGREAVSPAPGGAAAQEYVALAAAFAQRLAERDADPGADARAIGRAWGTGLATRHRDDDGGDLTARERVLRLLHRLGFSPETETETEAEEGDETREARPRPRPGTEAAGPAPGTTVLLRTCPLLDAARQHPEVVCQVHLGLVSGALETHRAPSEGLRLVPFARPGACVLTLPPTLVG